MARLGRLASGAPDLAERVHHLAGGPGDIRVVRQDGRMGRELPALGAQSDGVCWCGRHVGDQ